MCCDVQFTDYQCKLTAGCRAEPAKVGINTTIAFQAIVLDEMNNRLPTLVAMRTTHSSLSTQSAGGPLRGVGTNGTRAKPAGALFENRCPYPSEDGKIGEEGEKKELR